MAIKLLHSILLIILFVSFFLFLLIYTFLIWRIRNPPKRILLPSNPNPEQKRGFLGSESVFFKAFGSRVRNTGSDRHN